MLHYAMFYFMIKFHKPLQILTVKDHAMKLKISKTAHLSTRLLFRVKNAKPAMADFEGEKNEISVRYEGNVALIYCGLGDENAVSGRIVRTAAAKGVQKAIELKRSEVSVDLPSAVFPWRAALEGALLGAYTFAKYKSNKGAVLAAVELAGEPVSPSEAQQVCALCDSVNFARDLVNENAHVVFPEAFAKEARTLARKSRMKCTVLTEKDIDKKGLGLLKAVGQASRFPPRLVMIEYRGNPKSKDLTAIIGKGITFDSGGQNLKPTGSIETMRCDMAGAAAVLGAMRALSAFTPKINVVGVLSLAHNAIGRDAYFPGDVYTAYNKKTVEINSTDAEGRLVLADAISYCKEIYRPVRIIDLATLTGGIITALGTTVAGLFSNDKGLTEGLFKAGERTNERLWALPLYDEYIESMKSDRADLRNTSRKKKGWASSITGAAFIREFAGVTPWAHIDIAGTAFNEETAEGEIPQGATGFGVRLLVDFLTRL
jgi:leucyl aminopeptidase